MTQGAARLPCARYDRDATLREHMSNKNTERGEKRGVLDTGRAKELDKDADADAADDDED